MDITMILEIIGTVGFPIALVLVLLWFIYRVYKRSEQREDELRKEITASQATNAEAIKTLALYAERLGVVEQDVKEIKEILIENH